MSSSRLPRLAAATSLAALAISTLPAAATAPPAASDDKPRPTAASSRDGDRAKPWESYILAPESRTVRPEGVHRSTDVDDPQRAFGDGVATMEQGGQVTYDFGLNVGGLLTLHFGDVSGPARVGIAFSETARYVERQSEASTGGPRGRDGTIWVDAESDGTWTAPPELLRGAFRYATLVLDDDAEVEIDDVVVDYTASPLMEDLRDYPNYFYSSNNLLNRLWYAGAYTTQLTTIAPSTGRTWEAPAELWDNSATTGVGESILVDGAKRDRTVWPGDLGISQGTAFVSTGDTVSARNSILTAFASQRESGELPYAGPELDFYGSDTYHLWTLLATAEQYDNTADRAWVRSVWADYWQGVQYISDKVGERGLLFIDQTNDTSNESRIPDGEESMANVLYWQMLRTGSRLATVAGHSDEARQMLRESKQLRRAIMANLWDKEAGALVWYPEERSVHPQGTNALAVWWGLLGEQQSDRATRYLRENNWVERGARTPERDGDLQLLFGSFELQAQLAAGDPAAQRAAVDLMRRQWGWMLKSAQGPQSTFWESLRESGEIVSSYQSYAHGWSTGPTRALTEQVLGIQHSDGGATWEVDPHTAGLARAQGRLVTPEGSITVRWKDRGASLKLVFTAPQGTTGMIGVPLARQRAQVKLDGRTVWKNGSRTKKAGHPVRSTEERLSIRRVDGGRHAVKVRFPGLS